jgi:hypothetical protein
MGPNRALPEEIYKTLPPSQIVPYTADEPKSLTPKCARWILSNLARFSVFG